MILRVYCNITCLLLKVQSNLQVPHWLEDIQANDISQKHAWCQ